MPNRIKYSREKRKQVFDLYQEDRISTGKYTKGRYSLKQIEQMTGVPLHTAWMIANGRR